MTPQDVVGAVVRAGLPEGQQLAVDLAHPLVRLGAEGEVLLSTVECFLRADGSTGRAARALFVHRNTVSYRLASVRKRCGIGVATNAERVAWTLALLTLGRQAVLEPLEQQGQHGVGTAEQGLMQSLVRRDMSAPDGCGSLGPASRGA